MRILLVNYRYFISGGPEKYMFNITRILEDNGHEVIPFSVLSNKNEKTNYSKYFVEPIAGKDTTYFEEYKKTPKVIWRLLTRSFYSVEVKKAIQRQIKEVKPDVVYIIHFVNKLSPSVIRGAKQLGVPVVLRLSDYFLLCPRFDFLYKKKVCEDCLKRGYFTCIKRKCVKNSFFASVVRVFSMKFHKMIRIYKDVDAFICPSNFLKAKLVENGFPKNKMHHIPTFTSSFSLESSIIGDYGLYFGRISEEKGVELLIKAYEKLPKHKLVIMGDDTTEEAVQLKEYIKEKNLTNIEFVGFKLGKELEQFIEKARFVLVPSIWYDNLPNTILEAFKYSKPVIASKIGSLPEIVINKYNGYLFNPSNQRDLIKKIKLLDNDKMVKIMGKNATKSLEENFGIDKHYSSLMEIFSNVCQNNKD